MSVLVVLLLSVILLPVQAQDRFRVDCTHYSIYNPNTKKWSDWEESYNTFVININNNKDIMHFRPNGNRVTYRNVSNVVEKGKTSEGKEYQIISLLDENGDEFLFQLFNDIAIGIKFAFSTGVMIQFSNANYW